MSSFLHELHPCHLCHLCTSGTPVACACSFVDSLLSDVHDSQVSFFSRAFAVILRGQSDFHWSTRAGFLLSGCRGCGDRVDEDVFLQRNEKLFALRCRAAEYAVQRTLKHQVLDCEYRFFISNRAEALLECVCVSVTKFPMDVVEARSRSQLLLISAAHAEFLSDMFI